MIITSHLDGDKPSRTGDNNGQLIMCIPGCGGTEKSQLIRAVTEYFRVTNRIQKMRKLAPARIAAAEIGGMTIHSFLGEQLIDEMSMYRPVYDAPLHTDFSPENKKKFNKLPSEKEIQQRVARSLILEMNGVVKLTQQMRTEDIRYLQLLERLRQGQCSYEDYELLLTGVVGQSSVSLREPPWNQAPMLVFRNQIRTQLNHRSAIHNAVQAGCNPMVCVAQDFCKGKPVEEPALLKKLLELSDSNTEHLPVPGMPVILTQNIAIELGLINGMNGIFRQRVYDLDAVSTDSLSKMFPVNTQYLHKPIYALVQISKSKIECNLEKLRSKLIPIPIMEQTFQVDISDILPKVNNKSKTNRKALLSIKRRALPLVPAYSITTHKSQGQTLTKVVIDLKLPKDTDDIAAVYVPLSREKRLDDLIILQHFDYKVLVIKPSKSQVAEMQRLDKI
ncbi:unnamed protein product [Adineta ricciae]|uniref:DNA helicase n=1 Tax=Adineta ricciae TaxID=249248 RepID=A0A815T6N3_ADIRI|nr:unnamed protein product [Adineta ricciae]